MGTNRLAFLVIGLAAIGAAGGGAYLALRDNATSAHVVPADDVVIPSAPETVSETEAVVEDGTVAVPAAPAGPARPPRVEPQASSPTVRPERPARLREPSARPTASRDTAVAPVDPATSPAVNAEAAPPPVPPVAAVEPALPVSEVPPPPDVAPAEPARQFEELVVAADSVIGLQLESTVTTEKAKVEDPVEARVTRDVRVGEFVAIPAGSRVIGSVTIAERGGKMKERARLGVRFHTLVLADGTRTSLETETLIREGSSPSGESAAKIGAGAIGGAILGAILGGGRGAAIGGAAGAGAGTAAVMAGGRNAAELREGSTVTVRVTTPTTVTVER
jgi:type IV secretory pathway VirB10-like protein